MDAQQILSYTPAQAVKLFPGDKPAVKAKFRTLISEWHPDHNSDPQAAAVLAHIVLLKSRVSDGGKKPEGPKSIFVRKNGERFALTPMSTRKTDTGEIIVGSKTISYVFDAGLDDIADIEEKMMSSFKFADEKMKAQMRVCFPEFLERRDLDGGRVMLIQKRNPGDILLSDLLQNSGVMEPKHAAWLCSGLMNIAAWMSWAGYVHGSISTDDIMVDPDTHVVRLIGGWGFSTKKGERPVMLPERTMSLSPYMAIAGTTAGHVLDLELIRQTVREAMGASATSLLGALNLPKPILAWLTHPPASDSIADYSAWQSALKAGWGPRKFIQYPVSAGDVYNL